jgi:hypothetical protein
VSSVQLHHLVFRLLSLSKFVLADTLQPVRRSSNGHFAVSVKEVQNEGVAVDSGRNVNFVLGRPMPDPGKGFLLFCNQRLKDLKKVLAFADSDFMFLSEKGRVARSTCETTEGRVAPL